MKSSPVGTKEMLCWGDFCWWVAFLPATSVCSKVGIDSTAVHRIQLTAGSKCIYSTPFPHCSQVCSAVLNDDFVSLSYPLLLECSCPAAVLGWQSRAPETCHSPSISKFIWEQQRFLQVLGCVGKQSWFRSNLTVFPGDEFIATLTSRQQRGRDFFLCSLNDNSAHSQRCLAASFLHLWWIIPMGLIRTVLWQCWSGKIM